jgi:hypothetical protein
MILLRKFGQGLSEMGGNRVDCISHLVGEREQLLGNLQDLLRGATQISANALAC